MGIHLIKAADFSLQGSPLFRGPWPTIVRGLGPNERIHKGPERDSDHNESSGCNYN